MKNTASCLLLLALAAIGRGLRVPAQEPDGEAILRRVDENIGSDNKITTSG